MTSKRAYANGFQFTYEKGGIAAVLTTSEIERDAFHGLEIRMTFNLQELKHERRYLPAYLTEKFGDLGNPEKHPDIALLNTAIKVIEEKQADINAKLLPNLVQDWAAEAQIAQASHPSQNMLLSFLSDRASKPAPPIPQQG